MSFSGPNNNGFGMPQFNTPFGGGGGNPFGGMSNPFQSGPGVAPSVGGMSAMSGYSSYPGADPAGGQSQGFWGDMSGAERAALIMQGLGAASGIYGQYQQGQAQQDQIEEEQRRWEERQREREQTADALAAFLPTTYRPPSNNEG